MRNQKWSVQNAAKPPASSTAAKSAADSSADAERALPAGFDSAHMKAYADGLILLAAEQRKAVDAERLMRIRDALAGEG